MSGYYDGERFSVTRNADDYAVIDHQARNAIYSRHLSRRAAHKHARELNAQYRAERKAGIS